MATTTSQQHRPSKRTKHEIYVRPLPLHTHPLPAFHPQHPLSILRLAWVLLSELIFPPCSHTTSTSTSEPASKAPRRKKLLKREVQRYFAYLDPYTNSVHVTDPNAVRALWESGFFGKGNLSRSEPEWLVRMEREARDVRTARERMGAVREGKGGNEGKQSTAGEVTDKRRRERREMKMQRAREEIEALEEVRRKEEQGLDTESGIEGGTEEVVGEVVEELGADEGAGDVVRDLMSEKVNGHANGHIDVRKDALLQEAPIPSTTTVDDVRPLPTPSTHAPSDSEPITNQEHLHFTPAETIFLTYGLGILTVLDPATNRPLTVPSLIAHFARTTIFPPPPAPLYPKPITDIEPDNSFLLNYIVYHHFRSLGWVVRPGIKFSVDYLLYARGPVFSHAQFAVIILPAYTHPYWTSGEGARSKKEATARKKHVETMEQRDWWWFHNVNRVQAQVLKSLVLCWVEVPAPMGHEGRTSGDDASQLSMGWGDVDVGALLRRYRVKEVVCRRWTPQRNLK